jgi:hypothetical protein
MYLDLKRHKFFAIALFPAFIFYLFFFKFGVNAPYADDISVVNALVIRFFYGPDTWWDKLLLLFSQSNEHRLFYLSAVAVIQFGITGEINFLVLDWIGGLTSFGILFMFYRLIINFNYPPWLIIPCSLFLFNLSHFHNIFWTVCALQHNALPFIVFLVIFFLSGKIATYRFLIALLFAFLAVFTSGNGFLIFIAALPLLSRYSKKYVVFWLLFGTSFFLLYMSDYEHPYQRGDLLENAFQIKAIIGTFFVYLGSFSSVFFIGAQPLRTIISFALGLFMLLAILLFYWKNRNLLMKENVLYLTLATIFLFIFGTAGLYSLARANESIESVFESRYGINTTIFLIIFILLITSNNTLFFKKKWYLIFFSAFFLISSYVTRLVAVVNFSNLLVSGVFSSKSLQRGYYFYLDSFGNKADVSAPTVLELSQLPKPIVNITAQLPASLKYFNDVVYLSAVNPAFQPFSNHYKLIDQAFDQAILKPIGTKSNHILQIWSAKDGFRYFGKGISARITSGEDGVFAVLVNKNQKKWVFNLFWSELNRRKQLTNWDAIYVRNLDGIIPFKYLPDGRYTLKIFKVEGKRVQLMGLKEGMQVSGM